MSNKSDLSDFFDHPKEVVKACTNPKFAELYPERGGKACSISKFKEARGNAFSRKIFFTNILYLFSKTFSFIRCERNYH